MILCVSLSVSFNSSIQKQIIAVKTKFGTLNLHPMGILLIVMDFLLIDQTYSQCTEIHKRIQTPTNLREEFLDSTF